MLAPTSQASNSSSRQSLKILKILKISPTTGKKSHISTWSSSAMSTQASRPPLVSSLHGFSSAIGCNSHEIGHLIYKCGGIDKRTIEKFEKASLSLHRLSSRAFRFGSSWRRRQSRVFAIAQYLIFTKNRLNFFIIHSPLLPDISLLTSL